MRPFIGKSWRSLAIAVAVFAAANACSSGSISGGGDRTVAGLRFSIQPAASSAAGAAFNVSVELLDNSGAKIGNADDVVTLTVSGGASIIGNASQAAVNGTANFSGLSITKAGSGYTISATANNVTASSSSFTITPGAANAQQSSATFNPATITTGATIAVTFTFKDQYGNPIANKTVTLSSSLAGVTFTPSSGTTSATGTFATNMIATGAGSATLSATVDGVSIALPTAVTITSGGSPCIVTAFTFPGTANGTVSNTGCVDSNLPAAFFRFTTNTPGAHTFVVTSSFTNPSMAIATDPPGTYVAFTNSQGTTAGTDWMLPAGTYQARVASVNAPSGTFTLNGAVGPLNNTACTIRAFVVSVTITQQLAATDCDYGGGADGTVEDRFVIFSARSCSFTMTVPAANGPIIPWLEIRDAAAPTVGIDGDDGNGITVTLGPYQQCIAPSGGPLIIAANNFNTVAQGGIGTYTLTVTLTGTAALRDGSTTAPTVYESPWLDISAMATQPLRARGLSLKPSRR